MDSYELDIDAPSNVTEDQNSVTVDSEITENETAQEHSSFHCSLKLLHHACKCKDGTCCVRYCEKIKRIILHARICIRVDNCINCKQFILMFREHFEHCKKTECPVPLGRKDLERFSWKISSSKQLKLKMKKHKLKLMKLRQEQRRLSHKLTIINALQSADDSFLINAVNFGTSIHNFSPQNPELPIEVDLPQLVQDVQQAQASAGMLNVSYNLNPNRPTEIYNEIEVPSSEDNIPQLLPNSEQSSVRAIEQTSVANINYADQLPTPPQQNVEGLQRILLVVRNPDNSEQHSEVMGVLKSNPRLMVGVIKHDHPLLEDQQLQQETNVSSGSDHLEVPYAVQPENRGWIEL
ncbi:uncharacterized protein LOC142320535 [Lycorma delicatula]|uniref:uncharacterized protein LOC142320535 n=1 Tax=Lycorma delicatula TaxID=130591 RepID=UPI003F51612F